MNAFVSRCGRNSDVQGRDVGDGGVGVASHLVGAVAVLSQCTAAGYRTFVPSRTSQSHDTTSTMALTFLRRLVRPSLLSSPSIATPRPARPSIAAAAFQNAPLRLSFQPIPSSRAHKCTLIQVLRQGRISQRARKLRSPQLKNRPELKGVCLKVGTTKPKKPNSGERKIARVRLSTGKVITAYIPGEGMHNSRQNSVKDRVLIRLAGHNVQQHSVVMVRGGRAQDCPGVKYHLVRGALDLVRLVLLTGWDLANSMQGGVGNRITSRSKYGTKKPKTA